MSGRVCQLCSDLGVARPALAVWMATVSMCGERPRYPLCEEHLNDISSTCEDVALIEEEADG